MGVNIEVKEDGRLHLSGAIATVLDVPLRGQAEGFSLAFSDGTLLRGTCLEGTSACRFALANAGTGHAKITRDGASDRLELEGDYDWITLACGAETLEPLPDPDGPDVLQLTLDIAVSEEA